jgi:hypothetical protein
LTTITVRDTLLLVINLITRRAERNVVVHKGIALARSHVDHPDIVRFAQERVNLPREKANEFRAQARRLREKLEAYLGEHPEFSLRRIQLSGSLAKGTALRSLNDIDMAAYISGAEAPAEIRTLLNYLAERLRTAFPNFSPDQITPQTYSVTVSFRGSGLDVDVVPILYSGDPEWRGNLVSQEDGSFLETSIPLHLAFAKRRREAQDPHYAQMVRLVKFWAARQKQERAGFRLKSFMVELLLAHLADSGLDFSDYPEGLQHLFTYIAKSRLRDRIIFPDCYNPRRVPAISDPVQIIDPVNSSNNVSRLYTRANADQIIEAALEAGDAIDAALHATTKEETLRYWRSVFGPSFTAQ